MARDTVVSPPIVASGTTWAQFQAGGYNAILSNLISTNPAKANPTTQATVSATGGGNSGGSLPAGDYYVSYSFVDAFGETTIGSSRSAKVTVASGNIPRVTLPSLPTGVASINLYLTPTGGAAGAEFLYATGITMTSFDCSYDLPTDPKGQTPATNTTGAKDAEGPLQSHFRSNGFAINRVYGWVENFLIGAPMERRDVFEAANRSVGISKAVSTIHAEAMALVVANQASFELETVNLTTGAGLAKLQRVFS